MLNNAGCGLIAGMKNPGATVLRSFSVLVLGFRDFRINGAGYFAGLLG